MCAFRELVPVVDGINPKKLIVRDGKFGIFKSHQCNVVHINALESRGDSEQPRRAKRK
jgi:hypothetical protein